MTRNKNISKVTSRNKPINPDSDLTGATNSNKTI